MKMPGEGESDVEKTKENGEASTVERGEPNTPFKHKYRELKGRLKCLVYERECFESELQKSQSRLLELTTEKSVLLDQLMRYEPILLTDDEDELTDYSASEDEMMNTSMDHSQLPSKQPTPVPVTPVATIKSTGTPSSITSSTTAMKPNELTKHGIAKAAAIINSVSEATVSKALKAGTKRQAKNRVSTGAVTKIAKTVARTRDSQSTQRSQVTIKQENSVPKSASSLVISFPLKLAMSSLTPSVSTHTIETKLNKGQSPVNAVQNKGSVQVDTVLSQAVPPPPLPLTGQNATTTGGAGAATVMSSSSTGSSSSSSSSDSEDSGSESSSSSPDEAMDTGGPVPIISTAKNADQLPRPKAISSPVKVAPPTIGTNKGTPPPLLSPLGSPGMGAQLSFSWTKPPGEIKPPSSGLMPIAPSLSSPPSVLPFSSLSKPNSAFQIVSPRHHTQSSASLQDTSPSVTAANNTSSNSNTESNSAV